MSDMPESCKFIIHDTCYTAQQALVHYQAENDYHTFEGVAILATAGLVALVMGLLWLWCSWSDRRKASRG